VVVDQRSIQWFIVSTNTICSTLVPFSTEKIYS
jgi:hypothetical protein